LSGADAKKNDADAKATKTTPTIMISARPRAEKRTRGNNQSIRSLQKLKKQRENRSAHVTLEGALWGGVYGQDSCGQ